jgi:hypothetical protein
MTFSRKHQSRTDRVAGAALKDLKFAGD